MKFIFLTLAITVISSGGRADDVYNFYFQKADGPATVIQQGSGQSKTSTETTQPGSAPVPQTPAPEVQGASGATVTLLPEKPKSPRNSFTVGYANENGYEGMGVTYEYRVTRYLGLYGNLRYVEGSDIKFTGEAIGASIYILPMILSDTSSLDLGFVVGFESSTTPNYQAIEFHDGSYSTFGTGFVGERINYNFSRNLGAQAEIRDGTDGERQAFAGLTMRY